MYHLTLQRESSWVKRLTPPNQQQTNGNKYRLPLGEKRLGNPVGCSGNVLCILFDSTAWKSRATEMITFLFPSKSNQLESKNRWCYRPGKCRRTTKHLRPMPRKANIVGWGRRGQWGAGYSQSRRYHTVPLVQQVEERNVVAPLVGGARYQPLHHPRRPFKVLRTSELLVQFRLQLQALQFLPSDRDTSAMEESF